MASTSLANWHWRTKGVEGWSKEWFVQQLTGVAVDGVSVASVTDVEGDAECGMRKSKLVTIYDLKITMQWTATDAEGVVVTGVLVALEVAHDMDEDEYVFTSTVDSTESEEANKFNTIAKKALANKLRPKFQEFPKAMLATHGSDLLAGESVPSSGASTPAVKSAPAASSAPAPAPAAPKPTSSISGLSFNTSTVKASGEFQATASDLFDFLTNEKKIPMWSRNPARFEAKVGGALSLFGGNIVGKVTEIEANKSFSSTWRAPTWPENHFGVLESTLDQGSNSTTLSLRLTGVPVGMEDETEGNLKVYYLNALRSIGSVTTFSLLVSSALPMLLSIGLIGALGVAFYYGPSGAGSRS